MQKTSWKLNSVDLDVFEYISKPAVIFTQLGDIQFVNSYAEEFFQMDAEKLEKRSIYEFLIKTSVQTVESLVEREPFFEESDIKIVFNLKFQRIKTRIHLHQIHQEKSIKIFLLIIEHKEDNGNYNNGNGSKEFSSRMTRFLEDRKLFYNIIELNPLPIAIFNSKGYFLHANQVFYQIFREEPPAQYSLYEDQHLLKQEGFYDGMLGLRRGESFSLSKVKWKFNSPTNVSAKKTTPENSKWFNFTFFGLFDKEDQDFYPVLIIQDISKQVEDEKQIKNYQEQLEHQIELESNIFREFLHKNPYGVAIFDNNGRFIESNNAFDQILGFKLVPNFLLFNSVIITEFGLEEKYKEVMKGNIVTVPLLELKKHQFGEYPLRDLSLRIIGLPILDINRNLHRLILMFEDKTIQTITENLLEFERRQMLSIFDSFPEITYVYNSFNAEVLFSNQKLKEISISETNLDKIILDFQQKLTLLSDPLSNNQFLSDVPIRFEHYHTLLQRFYLVSARKIKWDDKTSAQLVFAIDITDRKKIEKELEFQLRFQKKLAEISSQFIETYNYLAVIEQSLEKIADFLNCSEIKVFELKEVGTKSMIERREVLGEDESQTITFDLLCNWSTNELNSFENMRHGFEINRNAPFIEILKRESWITFNYTKNHPLYPLIFAEIFSKRDEKMSVFLPIQYHDELVGLMFIRFNSPSVSKEYFTLLKFYCDLLGNAIDRYQFESQIFQERQIFEQIMQSNPYGIAVFDIKGNLVSANPVIGKIFKNSKNYSQGKINLFEDKILADFGVIKEIDKVLNGEVVKITPLEINRDNFPWLDLPKKKVYSLTLFPLKTTSHNTKNKGNLQSEQEIGSKVAYIVAVVEDITDIFITKNNLRETEEKFKKLFSNSSLGITIADLEGHILEANDTYFKMINCPPENLNELDPRKMYAHPGDRKRILEMLTKSNRIDNITLQLRKFNGELYWGLASILKFEIAQKPHVFVTQIDITNEINTRQELAESEQKFHALVESSKDIIWEVDIDGNFTYISPACIKILGNSQEYYIGRSFDYLSPVGDYKIKNWQYFSEVKAASIKQGGEYSFGDYIFECRHKNGNHVYLETNGVSVLDERGNLIKFRGVFRDITARFKADEQIKASESLYRSVVETSDNLIFILEENGKIEFCNLAAARLLRYDKENLEKLNLKSLIPGEEQFQFKEIIQRILNGEKCREEEMHLITKSGEFLLVQANMAPLTDQQGKIRKILCISQDVTLTKKKEQELRERELNLQYSNVISMVSSMLIYDSSSEKVNIRPIIRTLGNSIKADAILTIERNFASKSIVFDFQDFWIKNSDKIQEGDLNLLETPILNYFELTAHEKRPSEIIRTIEMKEFFPDVQAIMKHIGIESMFEVPIYRGKEIVGHILIISTKKNYKFSDHAKKLSLNVALLIGFALRQKKEN